MNSRLFFYNNIKQLITHLGFPLIFIGALLSPLPLLAGETGCKIVLGSCHRPPLSTLQGNGVIDQLAIEAFRRIGQTACITPLPCERSLLNADAGITDGDILRIPKAIAKGYPNLVAVPEVLYNLPMSGFTTQANLKVGGLGDLEKLRVGYILGWKILEDNVHAADTIRVRGPEILFPLLTENKADLIIYERETGLALAREMGIKGIRVLDPPLLLTPQHLVLNRRHQALLEPLAAAIRAIKADGGYDAAFQQAGLKAPSNK